MISDSDSGEAQEFSIHRHQQNESSQIRGILFIVSQDNQSDFLFLSQDVALDSFDFWENNQIENSTDWMRMEQTEPTLSLTPVVRSSEISSSSSLQHNAILQSDDGGSDDLW